jgi:suppressor for copper-sensitivity B
MSATLFTRGRRFRPTIGVAIIALLAVIMLLAARGASALESAWARTEQAQVRLVSAVEGTGTAESFRVGLQFVLQPGWKTYWRSPGDAGFPVKVDWKGSENVASATMAWPAPHRFSLFGLETFGYDHEVVFPVAVRPQTPSAPVALKAHVDYLVCADICIPYTADLKLSVPGGPASPSDQLQLIDRYANQVPGDGASHGLSLEQVAVRGDGAAPVLHVVARSTLPFAKPDLLVEAPDGLHFAAPKVSLEENGQRATLDLAVARDDGAPELKTAALTLTLVDGVRGLERSIIAGEGVAPPTAVATSPSGPAAAPAMGLVPVLLTALLGGLILNLMPCVLPVLSLKLLGIVGFGGAERRAVRRSFLASAAGIIVAFLVLGCVLAALKSAGVAVGWGIQFQQPVFLVAMVFVLVLFGANLWDRFEIPLPGWASAMGSAGAGGHRHGSLAGAFMTGVLATLLATPCSAPFLGTAVGFALSQGTREILAIFAVLGLGLALPYVAVAALPRLATWLPRPGRWMIVLRRVLGVGLLATAAWLLTVVAAEVPPVVLDVTAALVLVVVLVLGLRPYLPRQARAAAMLVVAVIVLAGSAAPAHFTDAGRASTAVSQNDGTVQWQRWDAAAIPALVAQGKTVFVNVTADWCITCQVNKRLVLDDGAVAARLSGANVVAMVADWTRPSDAIAGYLASFGRYGIPFNAVYGPGAPTGIALPELLTTSGVLDAFGRASEVRAAGG